jgi:hypothetical protein
MEAVRQQLGGDYKVKAGGNPEVFSVARGTLSGAKVHMKSQGDSTAFHVHGTGIIIGRIVNEFGIARKVAAAIGQTSLGQPGDAPAGS